eukprot:TRINITY_DN385_c0_g5_i2.p1 TRINITY_DN385_c0_g5~~TRINITY_DN385_c0_g5_i2.p1  ORF type:complete len:1301 (+),score=540.87 TRINITY_DN385_c0_g5_i2:9683-13585(+)
MAGVLHRHAGLDLAIGLHARLRQAHLGELEVGIAQAIAEGIQRTIGLVEVLRGVVARLAFGKGTSHARMVVVAGDLAHRTREGQRQLARGIDVAEEDIGNRIAAFGAGVPGLQDSRGVLARPVQVQRTAIHQHQYQRLAGRLQGLEQGHLALGQGQAGAAGGLVRHAARLAHGSHHHVRITRCCECFIDHRLRAALVLHHLRIVPVQEVEVVHDALVVGDVGAARIDQLALLAQGGLHPLAQGDGLLVAAGGRPAAQHVDVRIGQRADQGDARRFLQRQRGVAVFQQHHGLLRHGTCLGAMQAAVGIDVRRIVGGTADAHIRVLEQAQVVLGAEDVAHGIVELLLGNLAAADQLRQLLDVDLVGHAHVGAGLHRQARGLAVVLGHTVVDQLGDGAVVGHGQALEAPVTAQQVLQQPGVGGGRRAIDGIERHHHRSGAGIDGGAVRRQVVVVHALRVHVDHVVVAPAFDRAIQREVLHAGHDAIGGDRLALALQGMHRDLGDARDQVGVFAETFGGAAPARIAADVHHRREGHVDAVGGGFLGGDAHGAGHHIHVPARCQAQADGEGGAMAVDDVVGKEHRDLQARAHRALLQRPVLGTGDRIEGTADAAGRQFLGQLLGRHLGADADEAQLADFFFQGHLAQQVVDEGALVAQQGRIGLRIGSRARQRGAAGQRAQGHGQGQAGAAHRRCLPLGKLVGHVFPLFFQTLAARCSLQGAAARRRRSGRRDHLLLVFYDAQPAGRFAILFCFAACGTGGQPDGAHQRREFVEKCLMTNGLKWSSLRSILLLSAGLLATCAQAQAQQSGFSLEQAVAKAKGLADQPYQKPVSNLSPTFAAMQFADYMKIQPKSEKFEWRTQKTPFKLAFYHQGMQFNAPVLIHEIADGRVQDVGYSTDRFNFGDLALAKDSTAHLGYAGFRVVYPLNRDDKEDEVMSVLGASYFRVIGRGQVYGLSARGLAIDTAMLSGEEFPHFTEFWIQRPAPGEKQLTFYALLDSPRATGAYKFTLTPGKDALLDVQARVFLRGEVGRLGIAPLTSMFLFGPNQQSSRRNFRPAIHDSNGLAIHTGSGEWLWRPLNDPQNVEVSSFEVTNPRGFGLLQRGREFSAFEDLKDRYDLRPSAWIEPKGDWGKGAVQLVEIPTADETNDNIVAYWLPAQLPPRGTPVAYDYRIHWTMDEPAILKDEVGWVKQTFHTDGELTQANLIRAFDGTTALLVDFTGPALGKLQAGAQVQPQVSVSANGELMDAQLQPNPAINGWRLTLRVKIRNVAQAVELRAALVSGGKPVTETWSYQLPPRSDVQRTF